MTQFRDVCEEAARAGGRILLDMRGRIHPREKAPNDLVTEADFASQEAIHRVVTAAYPDHDFVGEEDARQTRQTEPRAGEYCWVVDPLDGTLNYTRQLPAYAVSIALRQGKQAICGVVYDPVRDECFAAELGGGATLNGRPIATSACEQVGAALIAASLPTQIPRGSLEVARFVEVMHHAQAIRRLGAASLNLCYLAMGRLDAYWATCVKIWDVAAGQLIVTEAGGTVTRPDGGPFDLDRPQFVAASTPQLHRALLAVLSGAEKRRMPQEVQ